MSQYVLVKSSFLLVSQHFYLLNPHFRRLDQSFSWLHPIFLLKSLKSTLRHEKYPCPILWHTGWVQYRNHGSVQNPIPRSEKTPPLHGPSQMCFHPLRNHGFRGVWNYGDGIHSSYYWWISTCRNGFSKYQWLKTDPFFKIRLKIDGTLW